MSAAITEKQDSPQAALDLDRSDWELVSFGDVALKQNTSVDRENTELTRYIAGEHMGSEDLHLREWGEIGDDYLGPAFTRKFEEGDILYGSRRTYLRKVAVAHFDGITANTTFVIKPNEELILKELLPFVMLSEGFAQHSIRNSKGSVNPYVNWKDIASYEFLLPPKDQQAKLAELLRAAEKNKERITDLFDRAKLLAETYIERNLTSPSKDGVLNDYCPRDGIKIGPFGSLLHKEDYIDEGIPVVMPADIFEGRIDEENVARISREKAAELKNYRLKQNDILFPRRGDLTKRALVAQHQEDWICGTGTIRVRLNPDVNASTVYYAVTSATTNRRLLDSAVGTTMPNLNAGSIKKIPLHLPTGTEADKIMGDIDSVIASVADVRRSLEESKTLLMSLINQIF